MNLRPLYFVALLSVCCAGLLGQAVDRPYHFNLLATLSGSGGSVDGVAADARFLNPAGVAVDAHGNLIVADKLNHAIRQIAPDGRVTTIAGWLGHPGRQDGQGSTAGFYEPTGVAIDRVGNIIVADYGNLMIRRVSPQGVVTTIAGAGNLLQPFPSDGIGTAANFTGPLAVATDAAGNIYVADSRAAGPSAPIGTNYFTTIRKITPDGIVSQFAGRSGVRRSVAPQYAATPADLTLNYVSCLTFDAKGNLCFVDDDPLGGISLIKITPGGTITVPFTNQTSSTPTTPPGRSYGLAVDAAGNVFLSDQDYHVIHKLSLDGAMTTVAGGSGIQGNVDGSTTDARFYNPGGLALDASGTLFVADTGNNTIRQVAAGSNVTTLAGHPAAATGLEQFLAKSTGLTIDASGNFYAYGDHTILKLTATGTLTTLAGTTGQAGSADGTGPAASFTNVSYLTVDANGNLYLIDGNAIRLVTSSGGVTTLAGSITESGANDATGAAARFNSPSTLAVDTAGNVFVGDSRNYVVRQVTTSGVVTTLAGLTGVVGSSDGVGSAARFSGIFYAMACASTDGAVFVAEQGHVRKITPDGTVSTLQATSTTGWIGVLDPAGNFIYTDGILSIGYAGTRIYPSLIYQGAPDGTVSFLGGGRDAFSASGTGKSAFFARLDLLTLAPDGRIFARQSNALFVGTPNQAPVAGTASAEATAANQTATFTLPASDPDGDTLNYTITGTAGGTATVTGSLATFTPTPGYTGPGSLSFTASDGYATSGTGTVSITITPAVTLLSNISTRGRVGSGDNVLIAGFVVNGAADTPKTVLVRAAGPALAGQGVGQPLSRPVITLLQGNTVIGTNQGWGTAGNTADIAAISTAVSAFAFPAGSNDSALLTQILPGAYTAMISGVGGDGVALAEVYDAEPANPAQHPVNISTRGYVGTGENILIAGFIVKGTSPRKFLIRAVGPGLAPFFRPGQWLADPQIDLYAGPTVTNHITGWTNDADMQTAVVLTGAFPLTAGSADAAAIVTLAPGSYTAMVSSRSGGSGIALVELYQLP